MRVEPKCEGEIVKFDRPRRDATLMTRRAKTKFCDLEKGESMTEVVSSRKPVRIPRLSLSPSQLWEGKREGKRRQVYKLASPVTSARERLWWVTTTHR